MTTPTHSHLPAASVPVVDARAWSCIDVISDLHVCELQPRTVQAWRHYLDTTPAQALFILGDLFEVWVGDDVLEDPASTFERDCVDILRRASERMRVYFMCGNRDFLAGERLMRSSGMQALDDPTVLLLNQQRVLLSHGDAWCLDDHDYLAFRTEVRSPSWQQAFLARPLPQRLALAREMRSASELRKRSHTAYADVDEALATAWLTASEAQMLVHGHTHRPATHTLASGQTRWVLSDWDAEVTPARSQVLRWRGEWQRIDLPPLGQPTR